MTSVRLTVAGALSALATACTQPAPPPTAPAAANVAMEQEQLPPGRVYVFHSTAQSGCPMLDWHVVLDESGTLNGIVSWDSMKSLARANGSMNRQTNTFLMTAKEIGGRGRTVTIDGTVNPSSGWLTANIKGANVNCMGIDVPWFRKGK